MWVLKISDVQIYIVRNIMVCVERMWCVNNHLNWCVEVENSQWLFCSQKTGIKCGY